MSRAKVLILLPCLLSSGSALAEDLEWAVVDMPYLEARSNESEADASLRALCAPGHRVILSFGAPAAPGFMGEGGRAPLTVKLESAGETVEVTGVSKQSVNSELTGGVELAAELSVDDPLFALLSSGKPVTIINAGGEKEVLTEGKGASEVKKFIAACGR